MPQTQPTRESHLPLATRRFLASALVAVFAWAGLGPASGVRAAPVDDSTYLARYSLLATDYFQSWKEMLEAQRYVDDMAALLRESEIAFDQSDLELPRLLVAMHTATTPSDREYRRGEYIQAKLAHHAVAERMRIARDAVNQAKRLYTLVESEWKRRGVVLSQFNVNTEREFTFREEIAFCQAIGCPARGSVGGDDEPVPCVPAGGPEVDPRGRGV